MPTRNINLTTHYDKFVESQVSYGYYSSASEVMRAGLTLLEKQKKEDQLILKDLQIRVQKARKSLDEGKRKAFKTPKEFKSYLKQSKKEIRKRASTE